MNTEPVDTLKRCIVGDDVAAVARMLEQNRAAPARIKWEDCSAQEWLLANVRSTEMLDLLLPNSGDVARVSQRWASGFGLNNVPSGIAGHLVDRGAALTPHAAAALGLTGRLRQLLDHDPGLVHARGGDGGRPLHFSRNLETARLLVDRGAEIDARDDDHDSTPAQWRIGDAPDVTRFLLERGATPDIFMAAALDDLDLARHLVANDPACTTCRIGNNSGPFPGIGYRGRGGTIYQWTLGFNQSPHEIARHRGHRELFEFLMRHTPPRQRFLVACMLADRPLAEDLLRRDPGIIRELAEDDRALLAKCCWETNLNRDAVRLMLDLGFPVDAPEFNHGYLPLHNAAWCGDPELVELLLGRGHPVDRRDPNHQSTALGWAIHSCVTARRHPEGDFPGVVRRLLEAGSPLDTAQYPTGHDGLDVVIEARRH